jgi:hypothetical protein
MTISTRLCALVALAAAVASPVLAVDSAIDLSGTWKLDLAHSDLGSTSGGAGRGSRFPGADRGGRGLPGGFPGGGGRRGDGLPGGTPGRTGRRAPRGTDPILAIDLTLVIEQHQQDVKVTRTFTADGGERRVVQQFPLDGSLATNPTSSGRRGELSSRASWKKGRLVNAGSEVTQTSSRTTRTAVKEEFSLAKGGRRLVLKTTRTTPRGEFTTKHVFNKESGLGGSE